MRNQVLALLIIFIAVSNCHGGKTGGLSKSYGKGIKAYSGVKAAGYLGQTKSGVRAAYYAGKTKSKIYGAKAGPK